VIRTLFRHSWRLLASIAAASIIATMGLVAKTVVEEKTYFDQEQARDKRQDEQLARLLTEQEERRDEARQQMVEALASAERLLADQFARHDYNVATKLNDLLAQIEALLARPAGTPPNPVSARIPPSDPTVQVIQPAQPASPAPTTTTTTPVDRRCQMNPRHPRC